MLPNENPEAAGVLAYKVVFPDMERLAAFVQSVAVLQRSGAIGKGMSGSVVIQDDVAVIFFFSPQCHEGGKILLRSFRKFEEENKAGIKFEKPNELDEEILTQVLAKEALENREKKTENINLN